jgi:hypothetical protein
LRSSSHPLGARDTMTKNRTDRARALARDWKPNIRRSAMDTNKEYAEFATAYAEEQAKTGLTPSTLGCYRALKLEYPEFPITHSALDKWMRQQLSPLFRGQN